MPTARRCTGCGATLPDPGDGATVISCRFCGLTHDLGGGANAGAPIVVDLRPTVRRASGAILFTTFAIVALIVGVGGYIAWDGLRLARTVTERVVTTPPARTAIPRRLALSELATAAPEFGWTAVDAPPPPGGFEAFDPVAGVPWALGIARAWATDAVLTRIDVGRVDATGLVDLGGERTSGYRFTSPGRQARWAQETDAGTKSATRTGLLLQLQNDAVRVLFEEGRSGGADRLPTAEPASLPLADLLARARKGRSFADRPFYSGYMIHLPREGWVWYFQSPSGDSFPRVRARDGRVYPY